MRAVRVSLSSIWQLAIDKAAFGPAARTYGEVVPAPVRRGITNLNDTWGLPGDVITLDEDGVVTVNGQTLDEPYVDELALGECDIKFPYQVPENRYFVLGDHRATSIDSRSSVIGCVEKNQIVGKVFIRVWPLSSFSLIH